MNTEPRWTLSENDKNDLISALTAELAVFRTKAGISQEELAGLIGVTRQTYGAFERKTRRMTWSTYLSLILVFDYNENTHNMLRGSSAYPREILKQFNDGKESDTFQLDEMLPGARSLLDGLDAQAINTIKNVMLLEFSRCNDVPVDAAVRLFGSMEFGIAPKTREEEIAAKQALKNIISKEQGHA